MKKFLSASLLLLFLFGFNSIKAQKNFWKDINEVKAKNSSYQRLIIPNKYRTIALDSDGLLQELKKAPKEFSKEAITQPLVLAFPYPDGSIRHFNIVEYSMMEPGLAEKFPTIKTYSGQGIEDRTARIKIDWTEFGLHAVVLSDISGSVWINPYARGDKRNYLSFYKNDLNPKYYHEDGVLESEYKSRPLSTQGALGGPCLGETLRAYRLAVTCTGEYATAVGATNAAELHSAIVTTVNRVNSVFESEVAIRLVLVNNNEQVEFLNSSSDPYSSPLSRPTLLANSQSVINTRIGSANYDIGHLFCTAPGGLAFRRGVCSATDKAKGVSGLDNPVGDPFDVDFVSHEIGHQFGATHSFNNNNANGCSGQASNESNAEPGSGVTIMAYAGQCGANNLQLNSIPHFQAISYDQITTFSRGTSGLNLGGTCGTAISTGNTPPVVIAGDNYTIPVSTPFMLTGSAIDANGDALTYSWEQIDYGGAYSDWNAPSGNKAPLFRSFAPTTSPTRIFPRITDIVNNTTTIGEILPTIARPINFRLTARDNRSGGSGICYDDVLITTSGSAPFKVTSQATAITWTANGTNTETITWDVAGTSTTPINVSAVDILLSVDGGLTYPYTLLSNTPNDGSQSIVVPSIPTTRGRVMVKARGNVFFNINAANIKITSSCTAEGAVIIPANSVSAPAGSSTLNLGLAPQYSSELKISGTLTSSDSNSKLAANNSSSSPTACGTFVNEVKYDVFTFIPDKTGTYTFNLNASSTIIMNIYLGIYDPASPCANFLKSNYNASESFSVSNPKSSLTQALTAGQIYSFIIASFSLTQPALPFNYSVSPNNFVSGKLFVGSNVYSNPGSGFGYNYLVVDNSTGKIKSISANSNLSNSSFYPAGKYTVYGLSFANSISNLNSFVGGDYNDFISNIFSKPSTFCANLSKNAVEVNITAGDLPVSLLSFTAKKTGSHTQLDWSTATEQNSSHFNIQRSADGMNFTDVLGKVNAAGNSNSVRNYTFMDNNPLKNWNYYRLEQIDINGDVHYSNIVAVKYEDKARSFSIYPNPAKDFIYITYNGRISGVMNVQIIDNKGAMVDARRLNVLGGNTFSKININRLASGVYILRYTTAEGEVSSIRFVKN